tara:strand:+ start:5715 stop:6854 length:1140 start_codon:yes stop_codon:yes gene_type:complete
MKIAILTQPLGHNYGGLLQAYALQTYVKELGFDVETVDRRVSDPGFGLTFKRYIFNVVKLSLGRIKSIPTERRRAHVLKGLAAFRDSKLAMSPSITSEQKIRDYFRIEEFHAVVVGSDQVWRPRYSPSILNFYLDFLGDTKRPIKRVAFAASFGVDHWEYTDELTDRCKELAQQFDAVSVRENSAVDFCRDKLGVAAKWVVDPTLLLEASDYKQLMGDRGVNENNRYVLSYILDTAPEKKLIGDAVAEVLAENVFSIKPEFSIGQVCAKDIDKCTLPSVESWLRGFHDASFVVTDSFHGTVFAILFNKPFIAVGNSARGTARFESLLSQFGLIERLVANRSEVTSELIHAAIDWPSVNATRRVLTAEAQEFLKTHLSVR